MKVVGPWSRRRALACAGGLVGAFGAAQLAVRLAARPGGDAPEAPVALFPDRALPARAAPAHPLQVAVPVGGRFEILDHPLVEALRRTIPEVEADAQGRLALEMLEIALPPAGVTAATGGGAQSAALAPLFGSGAPPDVVLYTGQWLVGASVQTELAAARQLRFTRPLDASLRGDPAFVPADYLPAALEVCRDEGELHALPVQTAPTMVMYSDALLDPHPALRPRPQWGWPDLVAAAQRLTARDPAGGRPTQYGLYLTGSPGPLLSLLWQHGAEAVETGPDGRRRAALDRPAAREALAFYAALHRGVGSRAPLAGTPGISVPEPVAPPPGAYASEQEAGTVDGAPVAMAYDAPGGLAFAPERGWRGYAPLPRGRTRAAALGVRASLAVPASARYPDASVAAAARLALRVASRVDHPARPLGPDALMDTLLWPRRLAPPTAEALEVLRGRAETVAASLAAARVLTLGDMLRTQRAHAALASLAGALQRGAVSVDQAAETAQRDLEALLR